MAVPVIVDDSVDQAGLLYTETTLAPTPNSDTPISEQPKEPDSAVGVTLEEIISEVEGVTSNPFAELGLQEPFLSTLAAVGYETPSPIQERTIPHVLSGRDVLGQAQTGTGKTAAFALPLLSRLDLSRREPQVLVLAPTRELAIQVAESFKTYAKGLKGFRVLPIYGGQGYTPQLKQLARGVHVIVGTPGRVMDHMRRGSLVLDNLQSFVLDEADEMLRMGFIEDVEWILEQAPEERQIALFSATMPPPIKRVAQRFLHNPEMVSVKLKTATAETIRQRYLIMRPHQKLEVLARLLEGETVDGVIIFVRTKTATLEVAERLQARGFLSEAINGDMVQSQRERTVERLKQGQLDVLVATDVAARGLDVERVSHVVNYDIPSDSESYVHRIGRTGRAGRQGEAVLFVEPHEKRLLYMIERATRQRIERMDLPPVELINAQRVARFKQRISDTLTRDDLEPFLSLVTSYVDETEEAEPLAVAAALACLVQRDEPLLLKELKLSTERSERDARHDGRQGNHRDRRDQGRNRQQRGGRGRREGMISYRVDVGHVHGVKPGNLVGAIANEGGLSSDQIGRINIQESYSVIDLPKDLSSKSFETLQRTRVVGRPLALAPFREGDASYGEHLAGEAPMHRKPKSNKRRRKPNQRSQ